MFQIRDVCFKVDLCFNTWLIIISYADRSNPMGPIFVAMQRPAQAALLCVFLTLTWNSFCCHAVCSSCRYVVLLVHTGAVRTIQTTNMISKRSLFFTCWTNHCDWFSCYRNWWNWLTAYLLILSPSDLHSPSPRPFTLCAAAHTYINEKKLHSETPTLFVHLYV